MRTSGAEQLEDGEGGTAELRNCGGARRSSTLEEEAVSKCDAAARLSTSLSLLHVEGDSALSMNLCTTIMDYTLHYLHT